jgi:cytochrome c biogenesis protein CcmG/thiol:disulfide interchange protein DsbE
LPPLQGLLSNGAQVPGLDPTNFKGKVSVVNVWASWCVPCHDEAPLLTELAKDNRLQLIGINYKDAPDNAQRFLGRYGNPFASVGVDGNGRAAIEWGVYGVPETFIVGRDGKIAYKLVAQSRRTTSAVRSWPRSTRRSMRLRSRETSDQPV